jgi:hypothetical protein
VTPGGGAPKLRRAPLCGAAREPFGQLPGKGRRAGRDAPPGCQPIALAFKSASASDRGIVRVDSVGLALALARKQLGPERDHEPRALSALPACHRDRDRFWKFDLARLFQWACSDRVLRTLSLVERPLLLRS